MRSLISIMDFSVDELDDLIHTAMDIIDRPHEYSQKCRGKKLATLFFEPSTRTRLSFEAAMYELGGNVIGFSEAGSSSAAKGESVADTAKVALFGKSPIGLSMQGSGCDVTVGFNSADRITCRFRADGADANIVESIIRLMCSVEPSRDFADDDFDDYGDDFGSATPIDGFSAF